MEEKKKSNKSFTIAFIVFLVILIASTIVAVYITIQDIDKNFEKKLANIEINNKKEIENNIVKKQAEDKKYALKTYSETYNENSLKIKKIEDGHINYVQIEGLKNTKLEKEINERIKNMVYNTGYNSVYAYVIGNFSNILSICIEASTTTGEEYEIQTLNIDLSTGQDIPIEKVFVSSAPLNLYLADALYENMAWNVNGDSGYNYERIFNMDYRDTSEYEDKFLMIVNKFKKEKDNIKFTISPTGVNIYDLTDGIVKNDFYGSEISIKFLDCIEEVAIYKRYLTSESIFKDDNLGQKDIIVLVDNMFYSFGDYLLIKSYGKIADNIFLEENVVNSDDEYNQNKIIKDFIDNISKEKQKAIKKEIKDNQAAIYQIDYDIIKDIDKQYYQIYINSAKAICTREYFENDAFKEYIKMKNIGAADVFMRMFAEYNTSDKLDVKNEHEEYKISFDGKLINSM